MFFSPNSYYGLFFLFVIRYMIFPDGSLSIRRFTNLSSSILFGTRVRQIRKQFNLSQARLAEKAGLSPKYISDIELGKKGVSLDTADKIAAAFDLPLSDILKEQSTESVDLIAAMQQYNALIESFGELEKDISRMQRTAQELFKSNWFLASLTRHPKN